jgi:type I restriction enzyme S subunit
VSEANGNGALPELPEGWSQCEAGEILTFEYGKGLPAKTRRPGDIGVFASSGRVGTHDEALVDGPVIVVGRKGAAGNVFVAEGPAWVIDTAYYVEVSDPGLNIDFLASQLQAAGLERLDQSTAIPSLSREDLKRVLVRLPPRDEQDRLVGIIQHHLVLVAAGDLSLRDAARACDQMRRSSYGRAVEQGVDRAVGELLVGIEAGRSFQCHGHQASEGEWGVIKVSAMTWGSFRADENKAVFDDALVDPRWEIKPGDLLVSRANTSDYVGASVLVSECRPRLLLSDKSLRLLPSEEVDPTWLQMALSAHATRAQMSVLATGTSDSMRNLSQDKLKAIRVRVPALEEQRVVVEIVRREVAGIDSLRPEISRQSKRAAMLRLAVLHHFSLGAGRATSVAENSAMEANPV